MLRENDSWYPLSGLAGGDRRDDVAGCFNLSLFNAIIARSLHFKVIFFSLFSSARPYVIVSLRHTRRNGRSQTDITPLPYHLNFKPSTATFKEPGNTTHACVVVVSSMVVDILGLDEGQLRRYSETKGIDNISIGCGLA